jgi:hypothetical protein
LAVGALTLAGGGPARAATFPDTTIPDMCGVQLKAGGSAAGDLDKVQALGVKFIRRGFYWEGVEKTQGVYDFSDYDRLVKDCQDHGLVIVGCIFGNHKLYGKVYEERGREGYAKFAAALAEHFRGANIIWEIWNEPNVQTFWGKHGEGHNSKQYADEYTALVKAVAPAMHRADPKCLVLGGSVSNLWSESYKWSGYCFADGILASGIDGWSVHPYGLKCPEDHIEAYATVRQMMTAAGDKGMPLVDTERGFSLGGKGEGAAGGDPRRAHEYQAWYLVREYLIDMLCGIKMTNWYEWSGSEKEGFSLLEKGKPNEAYHAAEVMIQQLSGYHFDRRVELAAPRDFVLRFVNPAGGVKLVAWTAPPAGQSPDKTQLHAADIPVDAEGTLDTVAVFGDKGTAAVSKGAVHLTLTGAPLYVTVRGGK